MKHIEEFKLDEIVTSYNSPSEYNADNRKGNLRKEMKGSAYSAHVYKPDDQVVPLHLAIKIAEKYIR